MGKKTKKGMPAFGAPKRDVRRTPIAERATVRDLGIVVDLPHYAWVPAGLRPGELLEGKYRIERVLGEGGMGIVLAARDEHLQRRVAVKVVRPVQSNEALVSEMFLNEARTMARVRDPHIVEIHSFGKIGATPYFVMEFVEGGTLEDWLESEARMLCVDEVVGIMVQLCKGVSALHDAGAVHRDLKPSNVLIGPGFRVVLADFGLSSAPTLVGRTTRVGTPGFMGPEAILGEAIEARYQHATDVYALGAILYRLVAGCPAFEGSAAERMRRQLEEPPVAPSTIRPELPHEVDEIVARCLHPRVDLRMPSVTDLRAALEAMQARAEASLRGKRIVIVDDDPDCLAWLEAVLSELVPSCRVESYYWGEDAEKAALGADLLISDLHLPGQNGAELVSAIRSNPETAQLPIIAVSGRAGLNDRRVLKQLGADAFLLKPLDQATLGAEVRRYLSGGRPAQGT